MSKLALFRVRVVLEATADVRLHAVHAPAIYALLAAYGRGQNAPPALPDGLMPDAPEQCRVHVRPGEPYALGCSRLAPTPAAATDTAVSLLRGLRSLGESAAANGPAWGGNFRVSSAEDLIGGTPWDESRPLAPLPEVHTFAEMGRLLGTSRLTLRFATPFRAERSNAARLATGGGFFDRTHFPPHGLLSRIWNRLSDLGLVSGVHPPTAGVAVTDNHLVWLDFSYGFAANRKRLGERVGELTLTGVPADWLRPLVLGQYARCGLNTRFGLGAYRIAALGPDPFPCRRLVGLIELADRRGVPPREVIASGLGVLLADQPGFWRRGAGAVRELLADTPPTELSPILTAYLADDTAVSWLVSESVATGDRSGILP